ncbi:hypothetical protein [Sphingomonas sp. R86520]|uniref:hypothetical protein n=1 Tax=Sphingomonas sp. R86520 TaxID=3093859 RepID=UPI0036D2981A
MEIIYVRKPNIYIAIDNGKIFGIQRNVQKPINPAATVVQTLSGTPMSDWGVRNDTLYVDGLMITDLAEWFYRTNPTLKVNAFGKHFMALFDGGDRSLLQETIVAVCRVVASRTLDATGEHKMFISEQWKQHAPEYADLMIARLLTTDKISRT